MEYIYIPFISQWYLNTRITVFCDVMCHLCFRGASCLHLCSNQRIHVLWLSWRWKQHTTMKRE